MGLLSTVYANITHRKSPIRHRHYSETTRSKVKNIDAAVLKTFLKSLCRVILTSFEDNPNALDDARSVDQCTYKRWWMHRRQPAGIQLDNDHKEEILYYWNVTSIYVSIPNQNKVRI